MTDVYSPIPMSECHYQTRRMTFQASDFGLNWHSHPYSPFSTPNARPPSPPYKRYLAESRYRCGVCGSSFHQNESKLYVAHVKQHAPSRPSSFIEHPHPVHDGIDQTQLQ